MRARNLDGLIFTIPYKQRAVALAAELGAQARFVGAINALGRRKDGMWVGEIFDGIGCVEAFRRNGQSFADRRIMLIGAGGAGRAVGLAIAHERPRSLRVHDIDSARARQLADDALKVDARIAATVGAPTIEGIDILVNVSPVGMLGDSRMPITVDAIPREIIVFDAIVKPEETPLLAFARRCGCRTIQGREMMRGQISRIVDYFEALQGLR
jgi:shikimate dehydrogenase